MIRLYDNQESGNAYKVRLVLARLGVAYQSIELDTLRGATRTREFLSKNPNGRVPLLELPDGRLLAESNAIIWFLAEGSQLLPEDRWLRAQTLQWMFFEQYSHEPFIAVLRNWVHSGRMQKFSYLVEDKRQQGYLALDVMEQHLASREFFVGERCSLADVALYAYTHVADEGGFELAGYASIRAWLERVSRQPGHVPLRPRA